MNTIAPNFDSVTPQKLKILYHAFHSTRTTYHIHYRHIKCSTSLEHLPQTWKEAEVISTHKPGKPRHDPSSYRPVSLLSPITKITKRTIQTQLVQILTQNSVIPHFQFGFRHSHSTTLQVTRITENILNGFIWNQSTSMSLFNVANAFDKVWHEAIIVNPIHYTHKFIHNKPHIPCQNK